MRLLKLLDRVWVISAIPFFRAYMGTTFYYSFHLPFSSYFTYKGFALTYTSATSSQPLSSIPLFSWVPFVTVLCLSDSNFKSNGIQLYMIAVAVIPTHSIEVSLPNVNKICVKFPLVQ
ncbi:hypothetical protein HID58_076455 [Brassica napus]|uniref:Uncharacterized protein n=1 Tax=Brassica napus TaxID=3708 RepID=A0ABQ7YMJ1_BRANA|nr:hypothetical protein HID58_076455 [Brassica napus]